MIHTQNQNIHMTGAVHPISDGVSCR